MGHQGAVYSFSVQFREIYPSTCVIIWNSTTQLSDRLKFPAEPNKIWNQRIIGPVTLIWVLRVCWIRTNLEIQEHLMFYNLSSIQKHQEQIWPCYKNGQGQPRVFKKKKKKKKKKGMVVKSSGSILKLLLFPSFCTNSRKIPFVSLFYMIFCFISCMYIKPQGKKKQPFLCKQKGLIILITVACLKNSPALWLYAHFSWFYTCT